MKKRLFFLLSLFLMFSFKMCYAKEYSLDSATFDVILESNGDAIATETWDVDDIEFISREKARQVYEKIGSPVFAADSGFYIENYPNYPGYPGVFVKRSGVSSDVEKLLEIMKNVENRDCYFLDCLTFFDGNEFYHFYGMSKGKLSYELWGNKIKKAKSNLWYVFIPENCSKTLAEMSDDERKNRPNNGTSATDSFIQWLKTDYIDRKNII